MGEYAKIQYTIAKDRTYRINDKGVGYTSDGEEYFVTWNRIPLIAESKNIIGICIKSSETMLFYKLAISTEIYSRIKEILTAAPVEKKKLL